MEERHTIVHLVFFSTANQRPSVFTKQHLVAMAKFRAQFTNILNVRLVEFLGLTYLMMKSVNCHTREQVSQLAVCMCTDLTIHPATPGVRACKRDLSYWRSADPPPFSYHPWIQTTPREENSVEEGYLERIPLHRSNDQARMDTFKSNFNFFKTSVILMLLFFSLTCNSITVQCP